MSKVLMNPQQYTNAQIEEVLDRKMKKFGSKQAMPAATLALFEQGETELARRQQQEGKP